MRVIVANHEDKKPTASIPEARLQDQKALLHLTTLPFAAIPWGHNVRMI
jgi:hypothetical protein